MERLSEWAIERILKRERKDQRRMAGWTWKLEVGDAPRNDVHLNPQSRQGFGEFVRVVPYPALHGRKFACDETEPDSWRDHRAGL